ncbi:PucR family transcriptional regulator [Heyndrickxia camelliae]|uniref:PucR family transcriptional regulator n=1 Tax=Heyndrickxia camelliae TaxID=1707093 RepID=A0A2N3LPX2_9BACI|nr:helix-turn-helix domain-containing protein [Heyndrickxia camelliae]PKR86658.1 PucR family transcriptional regulator [Heyndrickxia camelliae]
MIKQLKEHYPNAVVQPTQLQLPHYYCFYIETENSYIAIPEADISKPELELMSCLFPVNSNSTQLNQGKRAQEWYNFLNSSEAEIPNESSKVEYRIIQYTISGYKEDFELKDIEEAFHNIFSHPVIPIFISQKEGMIIESKHPLALTVQELYSAIQAFEGDFYFNIHFFIGQFRPLDYQLKRLYQLEKNLFDFALLEKTKERIYTFENVLPLFALKKVDISFRKLLFAQIYQAFDEDKDLWNTIKLYLENHSNTSQTAKQLFMHRNSLQYKIDKFIERTGIDIRSFLGALTTYLACLDYGGVENESKKVPKN